MILTTMIMWQYILTLRGSFTQNFSSPNINCTPEKNKIHMSREKTCCCIFMMLETNFSMCRGPKTKRTWWQSCDIHNSEWRKTHFIKLLGFIRSLCVELLGLETRLRGLSGRAQWPIPSCQGGALTWICPSGTHGLVYRAWPVKEVENYKDSKMTWRRRRKALIRIRLGSL
jgi:hypothetical protein